MSFGADFQPIILADELGSRLSTLVEDVPKSLLLICNRPLLSYQLDLLEVTGFHNVIILTRNSTRPALQRYINEDYSGKLQIDFFSQEDNLGTVQALLDIHQVNPRQFILVSGDLIIEPGFINVMLDMHLSQDSTATFSLKEKTMSSTNHHSINTPLLNILPLGDVIGIEPIDNRLLFISSSDNYIDTPMKLHPSLLSQFPSIKWRRNMIDTGFYIFSHFALDILKHKAKKFSNIKHEFIPHLLQCQHINKSDINNLIQKNPQEDALIMSSRSSLDWQGVKCLVHLIEPQRYCIRVNTIANYLESNHDISIGEISFKPKEPKHYKSFISHSTTISKYTQIGDYCTIGDSTIIGDKCTIKGSIIGKHCHISDHIKIINSVIMDHVIIQEGCKITNTIVCSGAYIHSNVTLTDSIVGYRITLKTDSAHIHSTLSQHS